MKQKNYKLRIIVYGKSALEDIKNINKSLKEEDNSQDYRYKVKSFILKEDNFVYHIFQTNISEEGNESIKNLLLDNYKGCDFLKVEDEIKYSIENEYYNSKIDVLNERISEILSKVRTFYDVLVILVDNLLDEDSKLAFKYFQEFSYNNIQQPFILFLTKKENNPNILDLFQFITNKYFDKRNVFTFKYPTNSEETEKFNFILKRCLDYYHDINKLNINQPKNTFDILLCGQTGSGKSTFINQFLYEKLAKERDGLFGTYKIMGYIHPKYPIRIFDTPGWNNNNYDKLLTKFVNNDYFQINNYYNNVDLILLFIELNFNHLNFMDIKYITYFIKTRKKIIIVLNDFETHKKKEIDKFISLIRDSLLKISEEKMMINEIYDNIVVVKLKETLIEYEDEYDEVNKTIIKQCYGMDNLFKKIYETFNIHKISTLEIECTKNVEQFISNIKKYELLQNIKLALDILVINKINCSKLILSYSKEDFYVLLLKDKRRKELLCKINEIFGGKKIEDIDKLYFEIDNEINHLKNKKEIISKFFRSIEIFKGTFDTYDFDFDAYFYNEHTLLIGAKYLKIFETELGYYDDKTKNYIKKLARILNSSIDGFSELSDYWKLVYGSLKKNRAVEEWVNKFFILKRK